MEDDLSIKEDDMLLSQKSSVSKKLRLLGENKMTFCLVFAQSVLE